MPGGDGEQRLAVRARPAQDARPGRPDDRLRLGELCLTLLPRRDRLLAAEAHHVQHERLVFLDGPCFRRHERRILDGFPLQVLGDPGLIRHPGPSDGVPADRLALIAAALAVDVEARIQHQLDHGIAAVLAGVHESALHVAHVRPGFSQEPDNLRVSILQGGVHGRDHGLLGPELRAAGEEKLHGLGVPCGAGGRQRAGEPDAALLEARTALEKHTRELEVAPRGGPDQRVREALVAAAWRAEGGQQLEELPPGGDARLRLRIRHAHPFLRARPNYRKWPTFDWRNARPRLNSATSPRSSAAIVSRARPASSCCSRASSSSFTWRSLSAMLSRLPTSVAFRVDRITSMRSTVATA